MFLASIVRNRRVASDRRQELFNSNPRSLFVNVDDARVIELALIETLRNFLASGAPGVRLAILKHKLLIVTTFKVRCQSRQFGSGGGVTLLLAKMIPIGREHGDGSNDALQVVIAAQSVIFARFEHFGGLPRVHKPP